MTKMQYPEESVNKIRKLRRFYGLFFLKLAICSTVGPCVILVLTQLLLVFLLAVSALVGFCGTILYISYRIIASKVMFLDVDDANGFIAQR